MSSLPMGRVVLRQVFGGPAMEAPRLLRHCSWVDDETSDPELLHQEVSEILVDLVRLARKRGRPRLKDAA